MNWSYIQTRQLKNCLLAFLLFSGQHLFASPLTPVLYPETSNSVPPPNWAIDPDDFEFSMNAVIRVTYNSVPSNAAGNIVGAFVGNELRGVASPVIIGGNAYFFLTIHSNQYFGEKVRFKAYYAPEDAVYATFEQVTFIHNKSIGDSELPYWINIDPNADFPPEWEPILADTTLVSIPFEPIDLQDYTVSLDGDPYTWSALPGSNLSATIVNGILTVAPISDIWIGTDSVRLIVTETTPNQLADTIYARFTVLPDYGPPVWQTIPDQQIFSGEAFDDFDLDDYLSYSGPCHQFDFDVFPFTGTDPDPAWPVVLPGNQPMSIIAQTLFADIQLAGAGAKLAGFVNGTLAGWASPTGVSPNVTYSLSLKNVGAGNITFRFYDAGNQYLYEEATNLAFVAGGSVGTVSSPYLIQLSPLVPSLDANGVFSIAIDDPTWIGDYPIDFIVWDCDYPDLRRDTFQVVFSIISDVRPSIVSPSSINFEENACSVLYDTQTSDPNNGEGSGLTYTLAGGADASRFAIDATNGILSWANGFSPDFENPQDADNNNTYQINIRVTNAANLSDILALTVTITNQATEPFAVKINDGSPVICSNITVNLLASGGVTYLWSTGATQPAITVTTAGTYSVTATSSGACTAVASVIVAGRPSITASGSNVPVCIGATIQLASTPSGGTPPYPSFSWTGPNNFSAIAEDPAGFPAVAASGGVYTVSVTDNAGCTATATTTITVTGNTAPTITAASNSPVCEGSNITLSSTPAGGSGGGYTYLWAGPNSFGSIVQNPAAFLATLAAGGTYQVTLTDGAGCTGVGATAVTVNAKPTITASSNSPVSVGAQLLLTSSPSGGSGSGYTFLWNGPNSFSSTLEDPTGFIATLPAVGVYQVTLTDGNGCSSTASTTVSVVECPTITASVTTPVCEGGTIALKSTPLGGALPYASFSWAGPGGYSAIVEDPVAFPATMGANGTYTVTITDQLGCTATASVSVTVNAVPSITAANTGPICEDIQLTVSSTPSGGSGIYTNFQWTGPDFFGAFVEDPAPFTATVASGGIYTVKVTDSKGCTGTATTTAVVKAKPALAPSSNSPLCVGATLNLLSNPSGGSGVYSSFNWIGPASFSSSAQNPSRSPVVLAHAGIYTVTVTDNAGCTATGTTAVSVSSNNAPSITAGSNSPVCSGMNLLLTSTPSGGTMPYTSFSWTGPNNYSSTMEDPNAFPVFLNGAGAYNVTVTDNKNCKASASVNVVVNGPAANPSSNSPVCPGATILLSAGPVLGGIVTYNWSGPNNFSSTLREPIGFPAVPGTGGNYSVTITQDGCSNSGSVPVTVTDVTPPMITCPANTTLSAGANCTSQLGTYLAASVSDNCNPNPTVTQIPAATTVLSGQNATQTVTLTANDGNGNTATCQFVVTLKDLTPPTITCPANTTIAANANCTGLVGAYSPATLSDNCAATPTVTQSPAASTALNGHNDFETVTLTASDGNGNTATCTLTVTLKDITPPTIICPANVTIAADANCSGVVGSYSPVSIADNCNPNPTFTQSPPAGTALNGHNDAQTIALTANDGNGNTATCTMTVTLKDVTKPTILCPANTTLSADANCSSLLGAYSAVLVSDNCNPNPIVTQSPVATTVLMGHNDFETVTLTADDGNGNTQFCVFTVTLKDVTKPNITCPANTTVAADGSCNGVVGAYSPVSVNDNCNPNPTVSQSPAASTVLSGHNDFELVTLTANDGNGNTQFCTFIVTLKDVTKPTITCPANVTIAADASCSGVVGTYSAVSVADNCNPNPTVTQSPAPSTVLMGHNDFETVTLTADDGNGNTQFCTFTVTLKDVTKPTITCPANTTLSADANCSRQLGAYSPLAVADNCNPNPTVTQSPVATTVLMGHNDFRLVTLTADDGNGNTQSCTFTVTLKDITPPTVVCKPFTAALNAQGTVSITTANVYQSGADNCGTVNQVSVVPNTFTCANLGPNTVVLTVNDGNGNTASCNAVVTVVDLIPPTMLCRNASVWLNTVGQGSITAAQINNGSTDNCTLASLNVSPNTFSCANLGANTVTLTGTDQSGNTATCQGTVTVLDTIKPTMLCRNATLNLNNIGQATLTVANINNGSFDNCTIATFTLSQTLFTCANLGANTVTLTGTDQSGNSASCTATVTIQDLILPIAKCKNITANLGPTGSITVLASAVNNGSSDNCSFTLSLTPSTFSCANIGINNVTLRATDASGNTSTCAARVTVKDVTPPTALCKAVTLFLNDQGKAILTAIQMDNGSTDNCSIISRSLLIGNFNCGDISTPVTNTLTFTDGSGNTSSCNALITVKDNLVPTAVCQNTTVNLGPSGFATVQSMALAINSFDNCSVTSYSPVAKTYTAANLGANDLVITVKDFSGNAASCTSVVTVLPNGPSEQPGFEDPSKFTHGISSGKASSVATVYPNPSSGAANLTFELPTEQAYQILVQDLTGKVLRMQQGLGIQGDNNVELELQGLSSGLYLVELRAAPLKIMLRLFLQK